MSRDMFKRSVTAFLMMLSVIALSLPGCKSDSKNGGGGRRQFLNMGTAPAGGAFNPVGIALCETLNEKLGGENLKFTPKGTKGSQENIRRLQAGEHQLGLSNSAISFFAVNGTGEWDKKYDIRAVVTIAPNVAMFVTRQDSGIKTIADLKDKRVVIGPAGAGFDMFVKPIIEAHGISYDDFTNLNNDQNGAVDMLADGQADAIFIGGAIPTASLQRACNEQDIFFIPFEETAVEKLLEDYPFFQPITVAKDKYSDLTADFAGLNVGSMHLITSASMDDDVIYRVTKTLYENADSIAHPAAKFINEKNAARFTGTPFHPGAIRFYKEIGIWSEPGQNKKADENKGAVSQSQDADAKQSSDQK